MISKLLVANRGEIAVRIMRTAADMGIRTVAVYPLDDRESLHVRTADEALQLGGEGPAAYMDIHSVVHAAQVTGADAVHPGYGFLAENAGFAAACEAAGLGFVGPTPATLALFGDKPQARAHASKVGVPVTRATEGPTGLAEAEAFLASLAPDAVILVKAVAGGGGRGIRAVQHPSGLSEAMDRCAAEALRSFGDADVYVEELVAGARHVEVQIVGDGAGAVAVLGERDCSIQLRRQKLVEIAPAPGLHPRTRERLGSYSRSLTEGLRYRSLGTMEFLVADAANVDAGIVFLECNPRIQVEHGVTEEIFAVDLVARQLLVAAADPDALADLPGRSRGVAVQARVNLERVDASGSVVPTGGTVAVFQPPTGPGIRVDTYAVAGYSTNPRYDPLLAKVVAYSPSESPEVALRRLGRALEDLQILGVCTTAGLARAIVGRGELVTGDRDTTWLETNIADLVAHSGDPAVAPVSAGVVAPM
ncbi:MAG: biotin carboxylase N-terminal domain-containing protein, partial [Acidimicrobiales bacterium]